MALVRLSRARNLASVFCRQVFVRCKAAIATIPLPQVDATDRGEPRGPLIVTSEIPGPRSQELSSRLSQYQ
ncbi:4-aminobutyrate aminotransferase, partial [Plakobranchus ocellatus]